MSEELENKEFDRSVQNKFSDHKLAVPDHLWSAIDKEAALLENISLRKRIVWFRWIILSLFVLLGGVFFFYNLDKNPSNNDIISESSTIEQSTNVNKQLKTKESSNPILTDEATSASLKEQVNPSSLNTTNKTSTTNNGETENISKESLTVNNTLAAKNSKNIIDNNTQSNPTNKSLVIEYNTPINTSEESATIDIGETDNTSIESLIVSPTTEAKEAPIKDNVNKTNATNELVISDNDAPYNTSEEYKQKDELLNNEIVIEANVENESLNANKIEDDNANKSSTNKEESKQAIIVEPIVENKEVNQNSTEKKQPSVLDNEEGSLKEVIQSDEEEQLISITNESDSSLMDSIINTTSSDAPVKTPITEEKALSKITAALFILPNFSSLGFDAASGTHEIYKTNNEPKLHLSFGANVGYKISDKLTLKLGLSYHQFKSEIALNDMRPKELPIQMDPVNGIITIFSSLGTVVVNDIGSFDFAGDDEDDIFLDDEDDFASLNFKEEHDFLLFDIPITLGYEIGKGKLKLLLEGGLVTSILTKANSKIEIGNVHSPDDLISVKDYHQTKKIVYGGTIGVGIKYNISKRLSLVGLPSYNMSFMNINENSVSKLKPNSTNFSFGLQFQF